MNLLAIETSASACSIALQYNDQVNSIHEIAPMQQARLILPKIQALLTDSSITAEQLDAIAYGCGPGSFTGIRIASSVAQGLSFALSKPIIQISSLALLAQTAYREHGWEKVMVALDARMNQIYWALYEIDASGCTHLIGNESVCLPEEIATPENSTDWHGAGDGWLKYEDKIDLRLGFKPIVLDSALIPNAKDLLKLAMIKYKQEDWVTAAEAVPVYLR